MKTTIITLALAFTALIGVSNTTYAAVDGKQVVTTLNQATPVSRIEVRGNVELYVSDGPDDQVKVYNNYYAENAVVQGQDGVLRIASYGDQKLTIWVSSACLQKISAYDNASVKSFGKLSAIELNVNVYDNASAQLNIDAYAIKLNLHGRAKADLSGSVSLANLRADYSSTLNYAMLNAEQMDKKVNFEQPKESLVAIP
jgi:Putative auto-transporter adhesin, head GIN domain